MSAIEEIAAERARQIAENGEGWSLAHDDEHRAGDLAMAAACYAAPERVFKTREIVGRGYEPMTLYVDAWPWTDSWWKPKDRRRDLVRAAALIVAEIERLDRAAAKQPEPVQMEWDATSARVKLREIIAEQDRKRGRPLTEAEQLDNLARSLDMEPEQFRIHIASRQR